MRFAGRRAPGALGGWGTGQRESRWPRRMAAMYEMLSCLVRSGRSGKRPLSLWSVFHPRTLMRWDWDESSDVRVGQLWQLREELARSRKVVYGKWYRNRATFFSRELFVALLATYRTADPSGRRLDAAHQLDELAE